MANYTLSPSPWQTFERTDGTPVAGGQLFTFQAGQGPAATTYLNSSGTPNTNPIILDAAGRATIFLAPGSYYYRLFDSVSNGSAFIKDQDNISSVPTSATQTVTPGIAGAALSDGQAVYLSDGSGALQAGRWYPAQANNPYSSTLPQVGFAIGAIPAGTSGSILLIGQVTSGIAVTVGQKYYIDATTPGAITSAAPNLARFVGVADSGTTLIAFPDPYVPVIDDTINDFRLTLTTGVPVTTSDVVTAAAVTVFLALYKGNRIALYDGSQWNVRTTAQISIAVPATTASLYDVFVFDNAGVATLELSAAWTSDTAIFAAGIYASVRPVQDGVYVKSTNGTLIDATRRYLGTFRTTGTSGQTEDSVTKRYLWNYYNRVPRTLNRREATATWNYTTATLRQANAAAANQVDMVIGVQETPLHVIVSSMATNSSGPLNATVAVGEDSTSVAHTSTVGGSSAVTITGYSQMVATLDIYPAIGRHFYVWLEWSTATGTTQWLSNQAATTGVASVSGLSGTILG